MTCAIGIADQSMWQLINIRCTRLYKTIMKAVGKQKLSVFDISKDFGKNLHNDLIPLSPIKNIDFSIIAEGSPFDKGPFIDIN